MIPRVLSLYWGGQPLSYLQYLTVVSFKKYNPSWKINLFMPKEPSQVSPSWVTPEQQDKYTGEDYLDRLKKLCEVKLIDFEGLSLHEVHRSDLIRWRILWEYGGAWSDMDILYIKPMPTIDTTSIVFDGQHHLIGFYVTPPKQPLFNYLYKRALEESHRRPDKYQVLGSTLFNRLYPDMRAIKQVYPYIINLPTSVVYPYNSHQIAEIFTGSKDRVEANTIGIHWYNGSMIAKRYQNEGSKDGVIGKYVKELECLV